MAASKETFRSNMQHSIPWTEKYRPNNIEDIVLDPTIHRQIQTLLKKKDVHAIFTGSPGIGKTTTVKCIAAHLLGDMQDVGYMEMNAAEDRGVRSISTSVPSFCKRSTCLTTSKIILLDEADSMMPKCQEDIVEMIKKYGANTKFLFTCNDSSKMIEPLQSLCTIIRYSSMTMPQVSQYLKYICKTENIPFNTAGLEMIYYVCKGDMREAINNLQKTAYAYENITKENVLEICKFPDPEELRVIIIYCLEKNANKAYRELDNIIARGYHYQDIITGFLCALETHVMEEKLRLTLTTIVLKTKIHISIDVRSRLQLSAMMARMILVIY